MLALYVAVGEGWGGLGRRVGSPRAGLLSAPYPGGEAVTTSLHYGLVFYSGAECSITLYT